MTTATPAAPPPSGTVRARITLSLQSRAYGDRAFKLLLTSTALLTPILLGFLAYALWTVSRLAMAKFGLAFVTTCVWDPVAEQCGAFPLIFGTLLSSLIALAIAVLLSLGVAI